MRNSTRNWESSAVNLALRTPFTLRTFTNMEETTWKWEFISLTWQEGQKSTLRAHPGVESEKPSTTLVWDPQKRHILEKGKFEGSKPWSSLISITRETQVALKWLGMRNTPAIWWKWMKVCFWGRYGHPKLQIVSKFLFSDTMAGVQFSTRNRRK